MGQLSSCETKRVDIQIVFKMFELSYLSAFLVQRNKCALTLCSGDDSKKI